MFLRGRIGLCQRMTRQKVKGTGHKQPADASSEPNFYQMAPLDPPPSTITKLPNMLTMLQPSQVCVEQRNTVPKPVENQHRPSHGFVHQERNEISPGMRSVHGAAHLLQGIASGRGFALPPASIQVQGDFASNLPQSSEETQAKSFLPDITPRNQEEV